MPKISKRKLYIRLLRGIFGHRIVDRLQRLLFDEEDHFADGIDFAIAVSILKAENSRYLFRSNRYRSGNATERFNTDLAQEGKREEDDDDDDDTIQPWLNDDEFLQKYRMSRTSFQILLDKIKDHPVFQSKNRMQSPVSHQLMTWLKFVGTEGSGASNSNQRNTFGIGYGTSSAFRRRVTEAIRSLKDDYYYWPGEEERKIIGKEIFSRYDFPHCASIADGTLFPLAFEPETEDAPDYSGRKYGYSLSTMIFCDHKRRIRHYLAGFPGSAHDSRVFKATIVASNPTDHFADREYCIGDSAFENSWYMVSAFKKPKGMNIPAEHEKFNEKMASLRIASEHCIGILKGRFPWLRSIRLKITEDKRSLREILLTLEATVIVHNLLIELGEEERDDWIDLDDFSDIDDAERAPYEEGDALNQAIPAGAPKNERRTRLMHYFEEHHYF
jgi:hypothetical protein